MQKLSSSNLRMLAARPSVTRPCVFTQGQPLLNSGTHVAMFARSIRIKTTLTSNGPNARGWTFKTDPDPQQVQADLGDCI